MGPSRTPARCQLCTDYGHCEKHPGAGFDTDCLRFERQFDLARLERLFARLRREGGLDALPLVHMETRILEHLARAAPHYSGLLEFSTSTEDATSSPYRFSLSLRGHDRESISERELVGDIFRPFGETVCLLAERLYDLTCIDLPRMILVGIDARPSGVRYKLYAQFHPGNQKEKLLFLRALINKDTLRDTPEPYDRLHLVGVDFDARGITRIKLYFLYPTAERAMLLARYGNQPLIHTLLRDPNRDGLRDFLTIRRIAPDGRHEGPPIAELDFGLLANDLVLDDLDAGDMWTHNTPLGFLWRALTTEHRLVPTRVSVRPHDASKMNLYYLALDPLPEMV